MLKPGETFSLNGVVGERTAANGFVEGFVIQGGKFKRELGGGVSQSATTTFNAMFFAGLKDVEHRPHTLYISRYPAGREATVSWPSLDMSFQNDTKYGVLVQAFRVNGSPGRQGSITVRMWSTKTYDKVVATSPSRSNFTTGRDIEDDSLGLRAHGAGAGLRRALRPAVLPGRLGGQAGELLLALRPDRPGPLRIQRMTELLRASGRAACRAFGHGSESGDDE